MIKQLLRKKLQIQIMASKSNRFRRSNSYRSRQRRLILLPRKKPAMKNRQILLLIQHQSLVKRQRKPQMRKRLQMERRPQMERRLQMRKKQQMRKRPQMKKRQPMGRRLLTQLTKMNPILMTQMTLILSLSPKKNPRQKFNLSY